MYPILYIHFLDLSIILFMWAGIRTDIRLSIKLNLIK